MESIFMLHDEGFWLLVIWPFAAGLILYKMPKATLLVDGKPERRWYWITAMMLVLPYILWAGYRFDMIDTRSYAQGFASAPSTLAALPGYIMGVDKDKGFYALTVILKALGISSRYSYFTVLAAFQILCMVKTFRRYSPNFWISIFLFVASTDYVAWMCNGIRQFTAVCMIFAAFGLLIKRRYVLFSLVVLLASTFHGSALLMLPFAYIMNGPILNRKTTLLIVGTALIFPFIDRFMPALSRVLESTQYDDIMTTGGIWENDDGTNMIRVLVYSIPALVALFGHRYIRHSTDRVMSLCINASMITMAVYLVSSVTSGIFVGRIPIYTTLFGYMSLPWLLDQIFEKQTVQLIRLMMILCYLGFFYYQMALSWPFIPEVL